MPTSPRSAPTNSWELPTNGRSCWRYRYIASALEVVTQGQRVRGRRDELDPDLSCEPSELARSGAGHHVPERRQRAAVDRAAVLEHEAAASLADAPGEPVGGHVAESVGGAARDQDGGRALTLYLPLESATHVSARKGNATRGAVVRLLVGGNVHVCSVGFVYHGLVPRRCLKLGAGHWILLPRAIATNHSLARCAVLNCIVHSVF